ncbi:MAG: hypothetical protein AABY44_08250 [Nitrospirota bacterium]
MRKGLFITVIFLIGLFFYTLINAAEETSIKITKCQYDSREDTLIVEYEFVKGPKGDHVHFWIDGKEKKPSREPKRFKLAGAKLSKGEYKIELKVNDEDHKEIGVSDGCKIVVK